MIREAKQAWESPLSVETAMPVVEVQQSFGW